MVGRVWSWVHGVDELRPGDHIAFNTGTLYYYQHAIVTAVEGMAFRRLTVTCKLDTFLIYRPH